MRVWVVGAVLGLTAGGMEAQQRAALDLPDDPGQAGQAAAAPEGVGSVRGTVTDGSGSAVAGAEVRLFSVGRTREGVTASGGDGSFAFEGIPAGMYRVSVTVAGFAPGRVVVTVTPGSLAEVPAIVLRPEGTTTNVQVSATQEEVAAAQVAEEETQRVFGVFPNFYVTYAWDAAPLSKRQKFGLALKTSVDPVSFALDGAVAGIEQATNAFSGFGQGAAGYGKRYGAVFADGTISTFVSGALLPVLFKQDPRYFYKGTGTVRERTLYALESAVMCRSDKGKWEPNYSNVLGNLATGAISNAYYPASDRNGAELTLVNGLLGTVGAAVGNLIEEFALRKVTPKLPDYTSKP